MEFEVDNVDSNGLITVHTNVSTNARLSLKIVIGHRTIGLLKDVTDRIAEPKNNTLHTNLCT